MSTLKLLNKLEKQFAKIATPEVVELHNQIVDLQIEIEQDCNQ